MDPYGLNRPLIFPGVKADPAILSKATMKDEISWSEGDWVNAMIAYGKNPDPVVRQKGINIYREMMEDDQIKAVVDLRKFARLSTPWEIVSADDQSREANTYADYVTDMLDRIDGTFEDTLYQIYSAIEYGFSISEIIFNLIPDGDFKGKFGIAAIKTREPIHYDFKIDVFGNLLGIVYSGVGANLISGMNPDRATLGNNANPFPRDKFIIYSYNSQFSNWYGRSDLLAAFRSWLSKKHVMKFWNIWLERYASPFTVATVDPDVVQKKQVMSELDDFIKNLSVKTGIRVPKGVAIELMQGSARSASEAYEKAIESHNRFICHALLVPNLLGFAGDQGSGRSGGSYALGQKQFDAFFWILEKMGRDTSEDIVGEQIIKRLVRLSFPNIDPKLFPKFKFHELDEDSLTARSNVLVLLANAGFINVEEEWVRPFLSLPKKDPNIVLVRPDMAITQIGADAKAKASGETGSQPDKNSTPPKASTAAPNTPTNKQSNETDKKIVFQERQPNAFEKKLLIKDFEAKWNSLEGAFRKAIENEMSQIMDNLVKWVQKKNIITDGKPKAVHDIPLNVSSLKETLRQWLAKIYLDAKLRLLEEVARSGVPLKISKSFQGVTDAPMYPWEPLPPKDAVDFFNKKVNAVITNSDGIEKVIVLATRAELSYFDSKAFAISGVIRDDILNDAKQVLLNAIKRNDLPGGISDLKSVFTKYVDTGLMENGVLVTPGRLFTIVRTNLGEAINEGRRAMMEDTDVAEYVQYWEYSAILDDRTTIYCECMDQKQFRSDELAMLNPPAHFNALAEGVMIETIDGDRPIEEIKIGDLVKTHKDRFKKVYSVMSREELNSKIRRINTSTGKTILVTKEHPILTTRGWKFTGDLNIGDILFENLHEEQWLEKVDLPDPQDFPTLANEPSVAWDVVCLPDRTLMSLPIYLKNQRIIRKSKINNVSSDTKLKFIFNRGVGKKTNQNSFVESRLISEPIGQTLGHRFYNLARLHWISFCHSLRVCLMNFGIKFGKTKRPMVFSRMPSSHSRICNRCLLPTRTHFNSMTHTPFGNDTVSSFKESLKTSDRLTPSPMPFLNHKLQSLAVAEFHNDTPYGWKSSTIISIVEEHYNGNVYNLGVEEDETYLAEGIIVHNCRSISVPITTPEVERDGVEIAEACVGRMAGFTDIKREPINIPTDTGLESPKLSDVQPEIQVDKPAQMSPEDQAITKRLRDELSQIITRCPYTACWSDKIKIIKNTLNVAEFVCEKCTMPFRVSSKGDLYLYDAGIEKWERTSLGNMPQYFKEKLKYIRIGD